MIKNILSLFIITFIIVISSGNAQAEYASMISDKLFLRGTAVAQSSTTIEDTRDSKNDYDIESRGGGVQLEYSLNFETFFVGFGADYEYLRSTRTQYDKESKFFENHYINPFINMKFVMDSGLYFSAGFAVKYLFKTETVDKINYDKKADLWVQAAVGYQLELSEKLLLDFGGRLGMNITNQQFKVSDQDTSNYDYEGKSAYDLTIFVGCGYKL